LGRSYQMTCTGRLHRARQDRRLPRRAYFLGATFDPVRMYRMRAVFARMAARGITITHVHAHATALMAHFLQHLATLSLKGLTRRDLISPFGDGAAHGNFLCFRTSHADHRGDRMRFGFGPRPRGRRRSARVHGAGLARPLEL